MFNIDDKENLCDIRKRKIVREMLHAIGEDPEREGLLDTPDRVVRSWGKLFGGYNEDPVSVLGTVFEDGACDEIVILKNIRYHSFCVSGDTMIDTINGQFKIKDLVGTKPYIYSYDESEKRFRVVKAENIRKTRENAEVWKLTTDFGTLFATPDHKIMTFDRGWVELKDLKPKDRIIPLNRRVRGKYVHINFTPYTGEACWTYEHNYIYKELFGLDDGYVVHHKNGNKFDNSIENLVAMTLSEHQSHHAVERMANKTLEERKKIAKIARAGKENLKETNPEKYKENIEKQSSGLKAFYATDAGVESKNKKSVMMKERWARNREEKANNHKVVSVEYYGEEDVYCMNVPKYHNFVANGLVVHNCEHHILPFYGDISIGYIPSGKVVGISKLARLVEVYARRLQIQERMTSQIADTLMDVLKPRGVMVVCNGQHLCMIARGVEKPTSVMTTSAVRGVFKTNQATRHEFLQLIR